MIFFFQLLTKGCLIGNNFFVDHPHKPTVGHITLKSYASPNVIHIERIFNVEPNGKTLENYYDRMISNDTNLETIVFDGDNKLKNIGRGVRRPIRKLFDPIHCIYYAFKYVFNPECSYDGKILK